MKQHKVTDKVSVIDRYVTLGCGYIEVMMNKSCLFRRQYNNEEKRREIKSVLFSLLYATALKEDETETIQHYLKR